MQGAACCCGPLASNHQTLELELLEPLGLLPHPFVLADAATSGGLRLLISDVQPATA